MLRIITWVNSKLSGVRGKKMQAIKRHVRTFSRTSKSLSAGEVAKLSDVQSRTQQGSVCQIGLTVWR